MPIRMAIPPGFRTWIPNCGPCFVTRKKNKVGKGDRLPNPAATSKPTGIAADTRNDGANALPLRSWMSMPRIAVLAAIAAVAIGGLALLLVAEGEFALPGALRTSSAAPAPAFVGSEACGGCHATETA